MYSAGGNEIFIIGVAVLLINTRNIPCPLFDLGRSCDYGAYGNDGRPGQAHETLANFPILNLPPRYPEL